MVRGMAWDHVTKRAGVAAVLGATLLSCKERPRGPDPVPAKQEGITYWNRIAGVFETHCTSCHATGGIAPFPLATFVDAREHIGAIGDATRSKHMPPWLPDTRSCAPLSHAREMPPADIDAIDRWIAAGAPEGDRASYVPAPKTRTFTPVSGAADWVAKPAEPYAPKPTNAGRTEDYHCFVLDPKLATPQKISALRIVPGAPSIVHHVLLFEVRGAGVSKVEELDAREAGPGYTCFGGIGVAPTLRQGRIDKGELVDFDAQMIVGWAPGGGATDEAGAPTALPAGTAIHLAPGSRLVMQVHYSLADNYRKGMTDATKVEMWSAKDGARQQGVWVPLLDASFRVPVGAGPSDPRATVKRTVDLPFPLRVLGVAPHMHLRGRSIRVEGEGLDGAPSCFVDVPRWDFHHQEAYWLKSGTRTSRATLSCTWDNSKTIGKKPPHELRWGEGTDDEMCLAFLFASL